MKKILLIASCLTLLFACKNPNTGGDTNSGAEKKYASQGAADLNTYELWAQQVRSSTDTKKPADFSDDDWSAFSKSMNIKNMVNTIKEAVLSGKHKAYDAVFDSTELSIADLKLIFDKVDTVFARKIDPFQASSRDMITIDNIQMKEDWYFDKEKFRMEKRVTELALVQKIYGEGGEFRGSRPLFWVRLNN